MQPTARQRTVFNHEPLDYVAAPFRTGSLTEPGYSCRALIFSRPGDVVQLPARLQSVWPRIREQLHDAGLEITDDILWDERLEALRDFQGWDRSVYFWGEAINQLFPDERRRGMVALLNDKNRFFSLARDFSVALPETIGFRPGEFTAAHLRRLTFPCLLKPAVSAQGMGIERCDSSASLATVVRAMDESIPFQIQEILPDSSRFLNLLYDCDESGAKPNAATEQIMEGFAHAGNSYPVASEAPWDLIAPLAAAASSGGVRGPIGFDIATFTDAAGQTKNLVLDCNPRFNGASYPVHLAQRLGVNRWTHRCYPFGPLRLEDLDLASLAYTPRRAAGVVLVNWGWTEFGHISVFCTAPEPEHLVEIERELQTRLAAPPRPSGTRRRSRLALPF